jgi:hypothetical protein
LLISATSLAAAKRACSLLVSLEEKKGDKYWVCSRSENSQVELDYLENTCYFLLLLHEHKCLDASKGRQGKGQLLAVAVAAILLKMIRRRFRTMK